MRKAASRPCERAKGTGRKGTHHGEKEAEREGREDRAEDGGEDRAEDRRGESHERDGCRGQGESSVHPEAAASFP